MKLIILSLLLLSLSPILAQDAKTIADDFFKNEKWEKALNAYRQYLTENASDSAAFYNIGECLRQLADYETALDYFKKAEDTNYPVTATTMASASCLMALNKPESALDLLRTGAARGAAGYMRLAKDSIFSRLHEYSGFSDILEQTRLNAYPCLKVKERRLFDFWLGEWDVYFNGNKVGVNSISLANGGCALHESYTTGLRNYTGQSINYYDPQDKKWHQVWVDSGGNILDYTEIDRAEGMLQFQCDFLTPQGNVAYSRLTFTTLPDGTVRQLFENSPDGETWSPGFEGIYKRIKD